MRSTDVLACNYINRDTVSARQARRGAQNAGCRGFSGHICGFANYLGYLNIRSVRERASEHEAGALSVHGERITGELQRERLSLTEQVQGRPRRVAIKKTNESQSAAVF